MSLKSTVSEFTYSAPDILPVFVEGLIIWRTFINGPLHVTWDREPLLIVFARLENTSNTFQSYDSLMQLCIHCPARPQPGAIRNVIIV